MEIDFLNFEQAERLAKRYGTPLLAVSRQRVKENYYLLKDSLPNARLFYAVKANPHIDIIKTIDEAGGGFDISSIGEFRLVKT
jgi:ornithine decarboxylase